MSDRSEDGEQHEHDEDEDKIQSLLSKLLLSQGAVQALTQVLGSAVKDTLSGEFHDGGPVSGQSHMCSHQPETNVPHVLPGNAANYKGVTPNYKGVAPNTGQVQPNARQILHNVRLVLPNVGPGWGQCRTGPVPHGMDALARPFPFSPSPLHVLASATIKTS